MAYNKIPFKRGDTYLVAMQLPALDGADYSAWTARSQVRDGQALVAELSVTWTDHSAGTLMLICTDTTAWPVKDIQTDVEFTTDTGQIVSTNTDTIAVQRDATL